MTPTEAAIRRSLRRNHAGGRTSASWTLTSSQQVAAGIGEMFTFFSDPANLQRRTPPFLDFTVLTLESLGLRVRCLARRPQYLRGRVGPMREVVAGDFLDSAI